MLITLNPVDAVPVQQVVEGVVPEGKKAFYDVFYVPDEIPLFELLNEFQTGVDSECVSSAGRVCGNPAQ
jgi:hypothetical protein